MQRLKGDVSRQVNKDLKFLTALNQLHLELMRRCPYVAFPQESSPTYDEVNYNLCGLRGQALRTRLRGRVLWKLALPPGQDSLINPRRQNIRSHLLCTGSCAAIPPPQQTFRPVLIEKCSIVHLNPAPTPANASCFHTFM